MEEKAVNGKHVTAILQECGFRPPLTFCTPEKMQYYYDRGSAVHTATEYLDLGTLSLATLDPVVAP